MDKKYIPIIIGFVFSIITFITIYLLTVYYTVPSSYVEDFIVIIPGPLITDILILYALPIVFYLLFYVIAPYLIQFYIHLHKFIYRLIGRPSKYGKAELGEKIKAGRILNRVITVSFFSFAISILMVQIGFGWLFREQLPGGSPAGAIILNQIESIFLGTFLLCAILIILFFPIWLLEDSGLVSYRVFHEERMPIDIQGVHSLYINVLLGYAGLTTILSLARFIYLTSYIAILNPEIAVIAFTPILLLALPFIVIGLLAIPVYIYERSINTNQSRIKQRVERFNFPNIKVPQFEEMIEE